MSMKKFYLIVALAFCAVLFSSCREDNIDPVTFYEIKQYQPYLGETWCHDYDFEAGNQYLLKKYNPEVGGACSAFRNGHFHGRNLDWYIRDYAMLVIHLPATEHRFASVGVVSSYAIVNSAMIASGVVPDSIRDILPIFTTDGINENGVAVNVNIVLKECIKDEAGNVLWQRPGYIPTTGNGSSHPISQSCIPRYILDNCSSVDDAIAKVSALNVVEAERGTLQYECLHFFVSDPNKSAVFEWYNNHFVVTEYTYNADTKDFRSPKGSPAIMTNFVNYKLEDVYNPSENWYEALYNIHPYAMGMERFDILANGLSDVKTLKQAEDHISKVNYSGYYTNTEEVGYWYSENAGYYGPYTYYPGWEGRITLWNDIMPQSIESYKSLDYQMQNCINNPDNDTWYTEFSIVYNLQTCSFVIRPQEGYYSPDWFNFTLYR